MTNAIHVMLDLETWGKRPGCDLRSIGACVFAPETRHGGSLVHDGSLGTIKPFYISTDNPIVSFYTADNGHWDGIDNFRKYNLRRDPETVQWWNDQSAEAQAAFADPVDLREALQRFTGWLIDVTNVDVTIVIPLRLYSHGPTFDAAILAAAYEAVGLPIPWHYRAPRDTRTAFDMAGVDPEADGSYRAFMTRFNTGTHHHALDDAIAQAKAVCEAFRMVREPGFAMERLTHVVRRAEWDLKHIKAMEDGEKHFGSDGKFIGVHPNIHPSRAFGLGERAASATLLRIAQDTADPLEYATD